MRRLAIIALLLTCPVWATTKLRLHKYAGGASTFQALSLSLGAAGQAVNTSVTNTTASGTSIQATQTGGGTALQWLSEPLSAGFTLSGTVTCNIYAKEQAAGNNAKLECDVYKYSGGSLGSTLCTATMAAELTTSMAANNFTCTPSSTAFSTGDRIGFKIFIVNAGTMGAGSPGVTVDYDGATDAADGSTWVQTNETVTFTPEGGSGSFDSDPIVQVASGSYGAGGGGLVSAYHAKLPNASQAGNCLVLFGQSQNNFTSLSVTDDQSNTWVAGPISAASQGEQSFAFYALNIAANTRVINLNASSAAATHVSAYVMEVKGCATSNALDGSSAATGTSSSAAAGSFTPSVSGDLVLHWVSVTNIFVGPGTSTITPGTSFLLTAGQVIDDNTFLAQRVYNSTSSLNPTMTLSASLQWESVSIALKSSAAGASPSAAFRIKAIQHQNVNRTAGTYTEYVPCTGNTLVLIGEGTADYEISSITDNHSNTYTRSSATNSGNVGFHSVGGTFANDTIVTITDTGGNGATTHMWYCITGAGSFSTSATAAGDLLTAGTLNAITFTPAQTGSIIMTGTVISLDTANAVSGGGTILDSFWFDDVDGEDTPCDRNNYWGHTTSTSTSPFTVVVSFFHGGPPDGWASRATEILPASTAVVRRRGSVVNN